MRGSTCAIATVVFSACRCGAPPMCLPPQKGAEILALSGPTDLAIGRARAWLEQMQVDPIALREAHAKGKKKLVEELDAYYVLWHRASPEERPAILERVRKIAEVTHDPRYHDMLTNSDVAFKQDSTSYLRAALLLDRMGVDIREYREHVHAIQDRLDADMPHRGPHQKRVFAWYYSYFGMNQPFPLDGALEEGVIGRRLDVDALDKAQVYELTHEIFGPFEYGDKLDAQPFSDDARSYLRNALPRLLRRYIDARDADLTAELVSSARYVQIVDFPEYLEAIQLLLREQQPDGSWGRYEAERARIGDRVRVQYVLHTTMVVMGALSIATGAQWNEICR